MAAGPRVGWARGPCHRVVRGGGRQQLADVADARQGRQRLIFKQCCGEQLVRVQAAAMMMVVGMQVGVVTSASRRRILGKCISLSDWLVTVTSSCSG